MKQILHPDHETINEENKKLFSKLGTDDLEWEPIYRCTCCGEKTSIDDSCSKQGYNLICGKCVYQHYDGWANAMYYHCHTLTHKPYL